MANQNIEQLESYLVKAITVTNSWSAAVMVPNDDRQKLTPLVSVNFPAGWSEMYNALDSTTLVGRAYVSREIQIYEANSIGQPAGSTEAHLMTAIAALPIHEAGKSVAAFEVIKDQVGAHFSKNELVILEKIAKELAEFI